MNIYEKLQEARIKFLNSGCKKTGENKFAGFKYFELSDIIPVINPIMQELKITAIISFQQDSAKMLIIDCEKPESYIVFETPVADATVKGCTPIQNLGSQQTYIRRYLYLLAFDIIENDGLDPNVGNPNLAKDFDDYKKDIDKAKSIEDLTKIKKEFQGSKLSQINKKELISYATQKFNEITGE